MSNPSNIKQGKKLSGKAVVRVREQLKEMVKNENWSQNAVQLLLPILNVLAYKPEVDNQFGIFPLLSNDKFSFIVTGRSTNNTKMTTLIPHLVDSSFTHMLRANFTNKSFLAAYCESVQHFAKIICNSTVITNKESEIDAVVQFIIAPIIHGGASLDDSLLDALKKLAPEEKLSKLSSFVPEFTKNIDKVSPTQLAKMARFVCKSETQFFKQILASLFDKTHLIRLESEATKELTNLINELHMFDHIYLQDMIQFIYISSSRIFKHQGGYEIFEAYVNNSLGCVLKNPAWADEPLVDRNLQLYLRLLLHCVADGDKEMLAAYKKHALCYADDDEEHFQSMFTEMFGRSFAEIFYFDNPKALWSKTAKMLPELKEVETRLSNYVIEDRTDCESTIADVITNNILNDMYITKE